MKNILEVMSLLKIIEGGFFSSAYVEIKEEIKRLVKDGKRVFLVVPEQEAVTAELDIMPSLPASAALNFEVTNFTRLANTAMRILGGVGKEYSDSAREALIMWRTLTELSPFLSMTSGSQNISEGLVEKAMSAVKELKGIGSLPDEIAKLADNKELQADRRLQAKLSDISKVMSLYEKLVAEKYQSVSDDGERLYKKLCENPGIFSDSTFFVCGFTSFTEPQCRVLTELIKRADVNVQLVISRARPDGFEFTETKETKDELIRRAKRAKCDITLKKAGVLRQQKSSLLHELCELLWSNFGKIDNYSFQNDSDTLRIFEASDVYEECEFISADIKRLIMNTDASYSDFAIIARDAKEYEGIIDAALKNANIPFFISKRSDLSSFEAVKLIYTAFDAVTNGFSRESVISYAKCRLSGISAEECDDLELYCEMWKISGARFTDGIYWNMSPDGYEARKSKDHDERIISINATRDRLIAPLSRLQDSIGASTKVIDYAKALMAFFKDISLADRLLEKCANLRKCGEVEIAEENEKLWDIIISSLDVLVDALGDFKIDSEGFLSQLKVVLSSADVGRIPAFCDEVTIGSADMLRPGNKRRVYLIGVNEGVFPKALRGNGYFTERDRSTLERLGLNIKAKDEISMARELFFFSRAFSAASESVTITSPKRDAGLAELKRGSVIDKIAKLLGEEFNIKKISDLSLDEKLYSPSAALDYIDDSAVREALIESGHAFTVNVASLPISNLSVKLGAESIEALYPGDISLSQSRIDDFISCPFSYYLKYNLKLSQNEAADFDARNIGTFIHAVLESFFFKVRRSGEEISNLTSERRGELLSESAEEYLHKTVEKNSRTKRTDVLLKRLTTFARPVVDGLCDELCDCKFIPEFFELKIGGDDENSPRPTVFADENGDRALVYGSVDRVDAYKSGDDVYVRVIDYKTGKKSFSPSDLDEGRNLQMFLYLKAIVETDNENLKKRLGTGENGKIIPAGVIYVQTDMSDVKIDTDSKDAAENAQRNAAKRRGMLLNDELSISAMNKDFIPIKYKKNGEPDARSEKLLYTEDGWNELNEKISEKVLGVAKAIRSGDISPTKKSSKENHCDTCKFKVICRKR